MACHNDSLSEGFSKVPQALPSAGVTEAPVIQRFVRNETVGTAREELMRRMDARDRESKVRKSDSHNEPTAIKEAAAAVLAAAITPERHNAPYNQKNQLEDPADSGPVSTNCNCPSPVAWRSGAVCSIHVLAISWVHLLTDSLIFGVSRLNAPKRVVQRRMQEQAVRKSQ